MKKFIPVLLYTLLVILVGESFAASLPNNIIKQIPPDYVVLSFASGLLNDDKLPDFIVAIS